MGGYLKRIEFILSGLTQIRCGSILNICTLALPRVSWDQSVCRPLLSIRVTPPPPYSATQYLQYPKYSHNIRVTPSPLYSVTTPPPLSHHLGAKPLFVKGCRSDQGGDNR